MNKYRQRLVDNSCINENTGCWIWEKRTNPDGYGEMWYGDNSERCHRVSAIVFLGEDIKGKVVMHMCDTPACVNPDHLKVGTQTENIKDMDAKGRRACGEDNGNSSLNYKLVKTLREEYEVNGMSRKQISSKYGVKKTALRNVLTYNSWRNSKQET